MSEMSAVFPLLDFGMNLNYEKSSPPSASIPSSPPALAQWPPPLGAGVSSSSPAGALAQWPPP